MLISGCLKSVNLIFLDCDYYLVSKSYAEIKWPYFCSIKGLQLSYILQCVSLVFNFTISHWKLLIVLIFFRHTRKTSTHVSVHYTPSIIREETKFDVPNSPFINRPIYCPEDKHQNRHQNSHNGIIETSEYIVESLWIFKSE